MKIDATSLSAELGLNVECFSTISSTLDYVLDKISNCLPVADLVVALHQTSGKGREGKRFYSPSNTGIYVTFVFATDRFDRSFLTPRCAFALRRSIEKVFSIKTGIKWVNDLYFGGRKVAGILVRARDDRLLVSFGVNIEMPEFVPDEIKDRFGSLTVSCDESKYQQLVVTLYRELIKARNVTKQDLLLDYRENCVHLGRNVRLYYNENWITGKCIGIADDFSLLLRTDEGIRSYSSGILDI